VSVPVIPMLMFCPVSCVFLCILFLLSSFYTIQYKVYFWTVLWGLPQVVRTNAGYM